LQQIEMLVWPEKLKLSKQLVRTVTEAGYFAPKQIQSSTLSRIIGGQDIIAVAPEGSGKTSAYILGVLMRLKFGAGEAPRALILVPDKERVMDVISQFDFLNKNTSMRIVGLFSDASIQEQMDALADGADIVVATPDRARAIYLKLGLNLNKIMMFVIDDAAEIVRLGAQLPVAELANSIIRCQHLVFTEVMHGKLQQLIDPFMNMPALIEVDELVESATEVYAQALYHVPDFKTKLALVASLLKKSLQDDKTIIFVSSRLNAEKVYSHMRTSTKNEVAILHPMMFESKGFGTLEEFKSQQQVRFLIIANELHGAYNLTGISTVIHMEIPDETETFVQRILKADNEDDREIQFINLATDLELGTVKKIEQAIGQKITLKELPEGLQMAAGKTEKKKAVQERVLNNEHARGEAFHEKKPANRKDYNYSAGTKAKMNKKKKH
jgi:ATP-dependent RNA helicase RhlE